MSPFIEAKSSAWQKPEQWLPPPGTRGMSWSDGDAGVVTQHLSKLIKLYIINLCILL